MKERLGVATRPGCYDQTKAHAEHLQGAPARAPSIDTVDRDLCRFDDDALEALHSMVVAHGLALVARRKHRFVHIDVDTTVEPLFGVQEGARPGPNPRYHGRPSYHPILARIAEADAIVGAKLRPGDTSFGEADVPFVEECIERARAAAPSAAIYVRIDGAGDCSALMHRRTHTRPGEWQTDLPLGGARLHGTGLFDQRAGRSAGRRRGAV
ncbi:transposase [Sorangium sp. So ce590]